MKSHEAPVTESMQQCIDYIKQNEDEIAEYVNSLFLAQKDVIREAFGEFGSNAEPHSHSL